MCLCEVPQIPEFSRLQVHLIIAKEVTEIDKSVWWCREVRTELEPALESKGAYVIRKCSPSLAGTACALQWAAGSCIMKQALTWHDLACPGGDCASAHHADSETVESQARDVAGDFTQGCQKWLPWVIAAVARTAN